MLEATTTKGAAMPPASHRESDDDYQGVIYANASWRVSTCKDNRQWIIQKAAKSRHGRDWRGVSYHTTRKALIRAYHGKTGDYHGAVALGQLPERIGAV